MPTFFSAEQDLDLKNNITGKSFRFKPTLEKEISRKKKKTQKTDVCQIPRMWK